MSQARTVGRPVKIEVHQVWEEGFANGTPVHRVCLGNGIEIDLDDRYSNPEQADAFLDGVKWIIEEYLGGEVSTVHWDINPNDWGWEDEQEDASIEQQPNVAA